MLSIALLSLISLMEYSFFNVVKSLPVEVEMSSFFNDAF